MASVHLTLVCSAPQSHSRTWPLNAIKRLLRELPDSTPSTSRASQMVWVALYSTLCSPILASSTTCTTTEASAAQEASFSNPAPR